MVRCPECGRPIEDEDRFCSGCGHPVGESEAEATNIGPWPDSPKDASSPSDDAEDTQDIPKPGAPEDSGEPFETILHPTIADVTCPMTAPPDPDKTSTSPHPVMDAPSPSPGIPPETFDRAPESPEAEASPSEPETASESNGPELFALVNEEPEEQPSDEFEPSDLGGEERPARPSAFSSVPPLPAASPPADHLEPTDSLRIPADMLPPLPSAPPESGLSVLIQVFEQKILRGVSLMFLALLCFHMAYTYTKETATPQSLAVTGALAAVMAVLASQVRMMERDRAYRAIQQIVERRPQRKGSPEQIWEGELNDLTAYLHGRFRELGKPVPSNLRALVSRAAGLSVATKEYGVHLARQFVRILEEAQGRE